MKIKLGIREITERDINIECPFLPDADDFDIYLNAFIQDIDYLDFVISVIKEDRYLVIELVNKSDFEALHHNVKELHRQFYQQFRTTGFEPVS